MLADKDKMRRDARRVKQILADRGWTIATLANHYHVSYSHMTNVLNGRFRPPVLQQAIAHLLGEEPSKLWGRAYHGRGREDTP